MKFGLSFPERSSEQLASQDRSPCISDTSHMDIIVSEIVGSADFAMLAWEQNVVTQCDR
jgi:hypothetical protein